jgi:hypothetical protein
MRWESDMFDLTTSTRGAAVRSVEAVGRWPLAAAAAGCWLLAAGLWPGLPGWLPLGRPPSPSLGPLALAAGERHHMDMDAAPLQHVLGLLHLIRDKRNVKHKLVCVEQFHRMYGRRTGTRYQPDFRLLRLMCPELDRDRPAYRMKESAIAKMYVDIYALDKDRTPDAIELLNWRDPTAAAGGGGRGGRGGGHRFKLGSGDAATGLFSRVLLKSLQKRSPTSNNLTLGDLNRRLDDLHRASSPQEKKRVMQGDSVVPRLLPPPAMWLLPR